MRLGIDRRHARTAALGMLVAGLLVGGGAVPAMAGIPVAPQLEGNATQRVAGLARTRLLLYASDLGGPVAGITMVLRTGNTAKTASAEDSWQLEGGTVTCTPKLTSCTIDAKGGFGTYGTVDLAFAATKPIVKKDLVCFGSDVVYATQIRRAGVLTGTLRLATKSKKLGVIRNGTGTHRIKAEIPMTMRRTTYTGASCANTNLCAPSAWLNGQDYAVTGYRRLPTGKGTTGFVRTVTSAEPDVRRQWYVYARGAGGTTLSLSTSSSLAAASIGTQPSAPFVTGTATFAAMNPKAATTFLGCDAESRTGQLDLDLTWHLPGRAKVHQVGPMPATLIRTAS